VTQLDVPQYLVGRILRAEYPAAIADRNLTVRCQVLCQQAMYHSICRIFGVLAIEILSPAQVAFKDRTPSSGCAFGCDPASRSSNYAGPIGRALQRRVNSGKRLWLALYVPQVQVFPLLKREFLSTQHIKNLSPWDDLCFHFFVIKKTACPMA
jgi:hypothetical protein